MKAFVDLLAVSLLACTASSSAVIQREAAAALGDAYIVGSEVWKRATPQAPNGYAPQAVDCPSDRPSIRVAHGLSPNETAWLEKRRNNTVQPMREFLTRMNITGFDAGSYIDNNKNNASALPNIAIAFSGGGYRAMTNGAGALAAFDNRTPNSTNTGQIGGLLQSATYIAGLSGGGWLVGSIYTNNFTSVQAILDQGKNEGDLWQLQNSILQGPETGGIQLLSTVDYYQNLYDTVNDKVDAGFNTSLTDYWARSLAYQLVNASEGGPAYTFSSIQNDADFANGNAPMPILVADERSPGQQAVALNTTNFEFNPFEMGSFDPTLYGFAPLRYVGSNFTNGSLPDDAKCVEGFDNAAFVMGTSSSLFNEAILELDTLSNVPSIVQSAIKSVLSDIGDDSNDIADYSPNPFLGYNNITNPSVNDYRLTLVDGGEDGQNIPLNPLIQPVRAVDVIFAIDSSGDTLPPRTSAQNWPNGTSLVASYERSTNVSMQNGTAFPAIPDANTFVNLGLNNRPTFFGCDASNLTGPSPLIVYLPNAPYVYTSNTSTYQMSYNISERNAMIENGYDVATMGNGTLDSQWPTCVGCAVMSRSWNRTGTTVPDVCTQCFNRYCWNGTIDSSEPALYNPPMKLKELNVKSAAGQFTPNVLGLALAAAISGILMI